MYHGLMDGNTKIAVKQLKDELEDDMDRRNFEHEVKIWYSLRHPHILPLIGASVTAQPPFMVCPYMPNGTLRQYVRTHPETKLRLLYEVAQALAFMHKKNIVHDDIKAANALIDGSGHVQLADFGFAGIRALSSSKGCKAYQKGPGTARWAAPERLRGHASSKSSDVYSFGVTMWEVIADGKVPFEHVLDNDTVRAIVLDGIRPERPKGCEVAI
ncbi:serine/threonine protein kinase [Spizellomyces punctatus DAOM BR117]|uniref:Serine/threonine protein kinase n=1 Tax=Spizellomyces punctatus (strain DAOM BR117) TaxID=645134 RepID=A0A0L0HBU5_SPIPD|nr:serine/threonine protein kinase [Spizellomyces punctatus DAOM BR117]KNC98213.1 serine/threonine protein kinase [Spizellomyces punctatus DAOM BR117]|eukprot:XP_016606253.1 serine/threonine protein kinase [Spizellomyces punctatus DAOM BR117]